MNSDNCNGSSRVEGWDRPLLSSQVNFFRRGILSPTVINSRNHKQWHAINQALDLVSGGGDGGADAQ